MKFFNIYQFLAPAILVPLSYWLWWTRYDHRHDFVLLVLSIPVLFAYIIPGIGTNVLGLWEFNTRFRLGKFRPHHGFVFGSATSMLTLVSLNRATLPIDAWEFARAGIVLGSVIGFWNWYYDVRAIKAGFILVYNRPYADGLGPEAIAMDYAPVLFGAFGLCYGLALRLIEWQLLELGHWHRYLWLLIGCNLFVLTVPVAILIAFTYRRYGISGMKPLKRETE